MWLWTIISQRVEQKPCGRGWETSILQVMDRDEAAHIKTYQLLQHLTSSALFSSCLEVTSLWNKKPISWWIVVTLQLSEVKTLYNISNLGMRKNSNHLLLLCSCSTSLIHFASTSWATSTCCMKKQKNEKKQGYIYIITFCECRAIAIHTQYSYLIMIAQKFDIELLISSHKIMMA